MDNQCLLKIDDFYFSSIEFKNKRILGETKIGFIFDIKTNNIEDKIEKIVTTEVTSEDRGLFLKIVTVGKFHLEGAEEAEIEKHILKYNTISIMMPYIRSQVSLITTQPGLNQPFMIPPLNIIQLVDSLEAKTTKDIPGGTD